MKKELTADLTSLLSQYSHLFSNLRGNTYSGGSIKLIEDFENIKPFKGDDFFEKFGVGNNHHSIDRPFERAIAYELLLTILHKYDKDQYQLIHKGTPYFFIGWTAFQYMDFERAIFYMDAAVSEDLRKAIDKPKTKTPAIDFMLFDTLSSASGIIPIIQLNTIVSDSLKIFTTESGIRLGIKDFVKYFIRPLLFDDDKKSRSILTDLYCFFCEYEKIKRFIELRSSEGGSIDPMLNHLFQGARVLESLLTLKGKGSVLKQKIQNHKELMVNDALLDGHSTISNALSRYDMLKKDGKNFQDYNFVASYIIRNATGHSLVWDDEFGDIKNYETLYKALVNSIIWSIYKLWIDVTHPNEPLKN